MRKGHRAGMSTFRAGLIALVVLAVLTYFGFSKANPFANPFELKAAFDDAANVQPNSPVRIAGVEVGKVKKVEPLTSGTGRSEEHTSELQSHSDLVCRLLLEKKKN